MTSIIFVTQLVDADDPVLGFVLRQVEGLVERGAQVVLVANEVRAVPTGFPAEVVSLGKERGWSRGRRTLRYEQVIVQLARRMRPATLLVHMCPIYLVAGAPAVRVAGGRSLLWFAHPAVSPTLLAAERLADAVLTTVPGSYPRSTPKLRVIGQAVDTERFPYARPRVRARGEEIRLVALGRIAPSKGFPTVIRGVAQARGAGIPVTAAIVGAAQSEADRRHRADLVALRDELGLAGAVSVEGSVAHERVADRLLGADGLVNAMTAGSADKVVFEAMACGRPVLASNPAIADVLGGTALDLRYPPGDHQALAARIGALAAAGDDQVAAIGAELRRRIETGHSLDHWVTSVMAIADGLSAPARAVRAGS